MSNSNLEVCKANEINELKDFKKYRLHEINNIKEYFNAGIKERKDIAKKLVNTLLLFIMQTKSLLHYLHCLAL